ncbi:MAG: nucleotide exchange factor GrpE [Rikenellaceae bacterium]
MTTQKINNEEINPNEEVNSTEQETTQENPQGDNMTDQEAPAAESSDNMADEGETTPIVEMVDWKDKFMRLQAEFDNYRKRTLKEKMELVQKGGSDVLKAILPVVDDMQRAQVAMQKSEDIEALRAGVALIAQKFEDTLKAQGVTPIDAIGKELDVDLHEAVARFAAGEEHKGKIIDVAQQGYMHAEKVLRFAKVVVGE